MVDPTAWAEAKLPDITNKAVTASQEAYAKSQDTRLKGLATISLQKEERQKDALMGLYDQGVEAWKGGDRKSMMNNISEMAKISPDGATKFKNTFQDFDKTNGVLGAMHLYNALAAGDNKTPEGRKARQTSIEKAIEVLQLGPDNPLLQGLIETRDTVDFGEQTKRLTSSLEVAKALDLLPKGGATDIRQQQLDLSERKFQQSITEYKHEVTQDRLKEDSRKKNDRMRQLTIDLDETELEFKKGRLAPTTQGYYQEALDKKAKLGADITQFESLAREMESVEKGLIPWDGGIATWVPETAKRYFGFENRNTELFRAWNRIRGSEIIMNLPSGPQSDKDIEIFSMGFPPADASKDHIASWLRGAAKAAKINELYYDTQLQYMEDEKDVLGFGSFWKNNSKQILEDSGINLEPRNEDDEHKAFLGLPKNQKRLVLETIARQYGVSPTDVRAIKKTGEIMIFNRLTNKWTNKIDMLPAGQTYPPQNQ